jgi:hypothetical protein
MIVTFSRSPSLPGQRPRTVLLAAALGLLAGAGSGDEAGQPAASVYSRGGRSAAATARLATAAQAAAIEESGPPTDPGAAAQAERIVASSLAVIGRAESLSIKLRQRVRIGDRVLVGTGRYLQAGRGSSRRPSK